MHPLLQVMIDAGISHDTLVFLLSVPLVATIFAFSRQVIGLRSFGLYVPLLLTYVLLTIGLGPGLLMLLLILIVATLARLLFSKLRLLYIPRMAIVLTLSSAVVLALFYLGSQVALYKEINFSILSILIIIFLVEEFVSIQIKQSARTAFWLTVETLVLVIAAFYLIEWPVLQSYLLSHPSVIIVGSLVINLLLARWSGLRLTEMWKFRAIFKKPKT